MTVYKAFYFMLLEKMQRAIKKKKKKNGARCIARKSEVRSPHLIYQCVAAPNSRSVPRELSTSFFLISVRIILEWKERLERFSGDFRRFPNILFTLHETAGLSEEVSSLAWRRMKKTSQRHPWTATCLQPRS